MSNFNCIYTTYKADDEGNGKTLLKTYDILGELSIVEFDYDHEFRDSFQHALKIIELAGLEVVATNDRNPEHYIILTKWDNQLVNLRCLFKETRKRKFWKMIISNEAIKFKYMMLSRYQKDLEYYFGHGGKSERVLYFGDFQRHIREMINLWKELPIKPEWLRAKQLIEYKNRD